MGVPELSYPSWQAAHIAAMRAVLSLHKRGRFADAHVLLNRARQFKQRMDAISQTLDEEFESKQRSVL